MSLLNEHLLTHVWIKRVVAVAALSVALPAWPANADAVKFMVPGATDTELAGINTSGDSTGFAFNDSAFSYGFIRTASGSFATFQNPNGSNLNLWGTAIDDNDDVTGYMNATINPSGFLRTPDGTITSFNPPNSVQTYPSAINATTGEIVGWYQTRDGLEHGFVRASNGSIISFDPPNSIATEPVGTNSSGETVGWYTDTNNATHGFLLASDGTITTFDAPGGDTVTVPFAINNNGDVVGVGADGNFLRYANGTYVNLPAVRPSGINDMDNISGEYTSSQGATERLTKRGWKIKYFDAPKKCTFLDIANINDAGAVGGTIECPEKGSYGYFGYIRN